MRPDRLKPRLSIEELLPVVGFYNTYLSTWKLIQNDTLAREEGPVVQGITFDRLSGGVYRPTGHIRVLVTPEESWGFTLPQFLNVKVRQISRREHPEFRDRVMEAIRAEFVPSVDRPLVAEEVLELFERQANPPRSPDAYNLAALNAYLGHDDRALYWCSRFTQVVNESISPWQDCDYKRRAFLDQLEKWLQAGNAKEQLEHVLQEERRKWGLV